VEEADAGDAGGSRAKAAGAVFEGDAAEGIDGSGRCGEAGGVEGFEALPRRDELAGDGFVEDGGEEDEVCVAAGLFDFGESVAGDGDDGWGEAGGSVEFADLAGGKLAGGRGEVDSVGGGGEGDVGAGVDEEFGWGVAEGFEDAAGEMGDVGGGEIFFAELDVVDAVGGPEGRLADESGLPLVVRTGVESTVSDGVAAHGVSVWQWRFWG
jgi:hypothetical protein